MFNTAIWLHPIVNEPNTNIEINAQPLTDGETITVSECRLAIRNILGHNSITLLMTNAQAEQLLNTLHAHLARASIHNAHQNTPTTQHADAS